MFERGKTDSVHGEAGCNVSVNGLADQFKKLAVDAKGISARMRFRTRKGESLPPDGAEVAGFEKTHHVEGLARVPDKQKHKWFVLSRKSRKEDSCGFLLAHMTDMPSNGGERMVPAGNDVNAFDDVDKTGGKIRSFKVIPGTEHTGGIQMLGSTLFIPVEAEEPRVELYDLSGDLKLAPRRIGQLFLPDDVTKAHYVAVVRLDSGRTFLMVNRADKGLFDMFLDSSGSLGGSTKWLYLGRTSFKRFPKFFTETDESTLTALISGGKLEDPFTYQCASLLTDRNSGQIFLFLFRQLDTQRPLAALNWLTDNKIDLFRLRLSSAELEKQVRAARVASRFAPSSAAAATRFVSVHAPDSLLELDFVDMRRFRSQSGSKMRGGASAYPTPSGRLIVYAGPQSGKSGKLRIGEITAD